MTPGERMGGRPQVLLVEDEEMLASSVADFLTGEGFDVQRADSLAAARRGVENGDPDLVLLDLSLPDGSGMGLLDFIANSPQGPAVLVLTADSSVETAVAALQRGAHDYLPKPFDLQALMHRIRQAMEHRKVLVSQALQVRLRDLEQRSHTLASPVSEVMAELHQQLLRIAAHDSMPVLVSGETGVGKEHLCQMLHEASPRSTEPYVAINCANLDRSLLQSELFGHDRGAFTGATESKRGLFELTGRGTLLLDEVAEMPLEVQAAFLRVVETGRFRRLGGTKELTAQVRVVAATNKNLEELVQVGKFRQDLLFRLNAFELRVPALRERPEDIRLLADHICSRIAATLGAPAYLTDGAYSTLLGYSWPGNIRELKNVIERTVVIRGGGAIRAQDLQVQGRNGAPRRSELERHGGSSKQFPTLEEVQAVHIRRSLEICEGNKTRAARLLGISRSTLLRKLGRLNPAGP